MSVNNKHIIWDITGLSPKRLMLNDYNYIPRLPGNPVNTLITPAETKE